MTDDSDTTEFEAAADKLVEVALDGDPEALKELMQSGALDDLDDEAEEGPDEPEDEPERPIIIPLTAGETEAKAVAKTVLRPTLQGALTVRNYSEWFPAANDLNELVSALTEQTEAVIDRDLARGEAMLAVQAHTLDAIFNDLARRAATSELLPQFETYLKLGL